MNNTLTQTLTWFLACKTNDIAENLGACVKYKDDQIAVFNFSRRGQWYATQNLCPHRMQMAISRGMIGSTTENEPKVACPFHKKTFSLIDGHCLNDEQECSLKTYPVKIEGDNVYIGITEDDNNMEVFA